MKPLPTLRPFFLGLLAIFVAIWGQMRLQAGADVEAALLFGVALLLFVQTFWRISVWSPRLHIEPSEALTGFFGLFRSHRSFLFWLGAGFGLGAAALSILALRQFQGRRIAAVIGLASLCRECRRLPDLPLLGR